MKAYIVKRVFLLLGYWLISILAIFRFAPTGHGSFFPLVVFWSWSGLILRYVNQLSIPGTAGLVIKSIGDLLLLIPWAYYLAIMVLATKLSASKKGGLWLIPGTIHLCGGLVFGFIKDRQDVFPVFAEDLYNARIGFFLISYAVSLAITLAWLAIDWRLAKRQTSAKNQQLPEGESEGAV